MQRNVDWEYPAAVREQTEYLLELLFTKWGGDPAEELSLVKL